MARSVTKTVRAARRVDAEARQRVYDEYTLEEKTLRAKPGSKQWIRLTKLAQKERRGKRKANDSGHLATP